MKQTINLIYRMLASDASGRSMNDRDYRDWRRQMHVNTNIAIYEPPAPLRMITQAYAGLLHAVFALLPAYLIGYLPFYQDPTLKFENHLFHEIAIAVATSRGLFVTYLTWCCYNSSGQPLLRWLTLGSIG